MKITKPKQRVLWGMNPRSRVIKNKKIYNRQKAIKDVIRGEQG